MTKNKTIILYKLTFYQSLIHTVGPVGHFKKWLANSNIFIIVFKNTKVSDIWVSIQAFTRQPRTGYIKIELSVFRYWFNKLKLQVDSRFIESIPGSFYPKWISSTANDRRKWWLEGIYRHNICLEVERKNNNSTISSTKWG